MDYASTVMTVLGEANEELVQQMKNGDVNMNDFWKRIFADEMEEQSKIIEEQGMTIVEQGKKLEEKDKENLSLKKTIESLRAELAKQSSKSALL